MFTIIVVSYNPGEKLRSTLESIYSQTYSDYRVIIKDGGSTDGSLNGLNGLGGRGHGTIFADGLTNGLLGTGSEGHFFANSDLSSRTHIEVSPDKGIYDAMNQAVAIAIEEKVSDTDDYFIFMNCGDSFYDNQVLERVASYIETCKAFSRDSFNETAKSANRKMPNASVNEAAAEDVVAAAPAIYYGDQYNEQTNTQVTSVPSINEFALFRNVPCHQTCFYDSRLFTARPDGNPPYDISLRVRADYEHFLHSVYVRGAKTVHMPIIISNYEGGGFSETPENRRKSAEEHRIITDRYMGSRAARYRLLLKLSGSGIRTYLSESPRWSKGYNSLKSWLYSLKRK